MRPKLTVTLADTEDFLKTVEEAKLFISDKIAVDRSIQKLYEDIMSDPKK